MQPTLPGFKYLTSDDSEMFALWQMLWPEGQCNPEMNLETALNLQPWSLSHEPKKKQDQLRAAFQLEGGAQEPTPDTSPATPIPDQGNQRELCCIDLDKHPQFRVSSIRSQLGRKDIHYSSYLVRDEYRALLAKLDESNRPLKRKYGDPHEGESIIVSGQPGIGKTWSLLYLLFTSLCRGDPIFFQDNKGVLYFDAKGVQFAKEASLEILGAFRAALNRSRFLMAIDSPNYIIDSEPWQMEARQLVLALSPIAERVKKFTTQSYVKYWYMDVWSMEEIVAQTAILDRDPATIVARLREFGPIPRQLLDQPEEVLDQWKISQSQILGKTPISQLLEASISNVSKLESNKLILIKPNLPNRAQCTSHFLSTAAFEIVSAALDRSIALETQMQTLISTRVPGAESFAGKLFENAVHKKLQEGGADAQAFGCSSDTHFQTIDFLGDAQTFTVTLPSAPLLPLYLRPVSKIFPVIDSILVPNKQEVWLLQMTVSDTHDFNIAYLASVFRQLRHSHVLPKLGKTNHPKNLYFCLAGPKSDATKRSALIAKKSIEEWRKNDRDFNETRAKAVLGASYELTSLDNDYVCALEAKAAQFDLKTCKFTLLPF